MKLRLCIKNYNKNLKGVMWFQFKLSFANSSYLKKLKKILCGVVGIFDCFSSKDKKFVAPSRFAQFCWIIVS